MLDVAGGSRGSPGASGVGRHPRALRAQVLGNLLPEPGVGEAAWGLERESRGSREQGNEDASGATGGTGMVHWAWVPAGPQTLALVRVHSDRVPTSPSSHPGDSRATGRGEGLCPFLSNFFSISVLHPNGRVPSLESLAPVKVS